MREIQYIEISFGTLFKAALLVIAILVLWVLREIVAVVLLSIVIASAIEPINHWAAKYKIPRIASVIFIYLAAFFLFATVFYLIVPPLFNDIFNFVSTLPTFVDSALRPGGAVASIFPDLPVAINKSLTATASQFQQFATGTVNGIFSTNSTLIGGVFSFILLIVISFYISVQEHGIEKFLRVVTPLKHEEYILNLWARSQKKIGGWLQGQILLASLVGIIVFLGLTILDVRYAISLAILSAVFEIIPVFGPIMAAIPAIAVASIQSTVLAIWVLALYIVVQQFENHLIYPLVVRKTIGVNPLLVVLSIVVGGALGGLFGIILAVPIAAVFVEFLNDIASRKVQVK